MKCLDRVRVSDPMLHIPRAQLISRLYQTILKTLHAQVVADIAEQVKNAYTADLPGLPYPELPVVALSGDFLPSPHIYACTVLRNVDHSGATSALLSEVVNALSECEDAEEGADGLQVHLYPADCSSVMNTMKAIVTGFVDRRGEFFAIHSAIEYQSMSAESGKRKPTSLANFDINLLCTWYDAQEIRPRLTVFLHDFEKFDSNVVQDALYICR